MIGLTPRLKEIYQMVPMVETIADIGTDHAYLPVALMQGKKAANVIACDVRKGPLERAQRTISQYGMEAHIETRLGNGLCALKEKEAQVVVMAGMGGNLMADILAQGQNVAETVSCFIFQPMQYPQMLRQYLYEHHYLIVSESLAKEESKYYQIIKAVHGQDEAKSHMDFAIGTLIFNRRDALLLEFLIDKYQKYRMVYEKVAESKRKDALKKRAEIFEDMTWLAKKIEALEVDLGQKK